MNKGELNGRSKLTEEKVKLIRQERKNGMFYKNISDMFSISMSQAQAICNNKYWKPKRKKHTSDRVKRFALDN